MKGEQKMMRRDMRSLWGKTELKNGNKSELSRTPITIIICHIQYSKDSWKTLKHDTKKDKPVSIHVQSLWAVVHHVIVPPLSNTLDIFICIYLYYIKQRKKRKKHCFFSLYTSVERLCPSAGDYCPSLLLLVMEVNTRHLRGGLGGGSLSLCTRERQFPVRWTTPSLIRRWSPGCQCQWWPCPPTRRPTRRCPWPRWCGRCLCDGTCSGWGTPECTGWWRSLPRWYLQRTCWI